MGHIHIGKNGKLWFKTLVLGMAWCNLVLPGQEAERSMHTHQLNTGPGSYNGRACQAGGGKAGVSKRLPQNTPPAGATGNSKPTALPHPHHFGRGIIEWRAGTHLPQDAPVVVPAVQVVDGLLEGHKVERLPVQPLERLLRACHVWCVYMCACMWVSVCAYL